MHKYLVSFAGCGIDWPACDNIFITLKKISMFSAGRCDISPKYDYDHFCESNIAVIQTGDLLC